MLEQDARQEARLALEEMLSRELSARERYAKLPGYKVDMCLRWVAEGATPVLREQRISRLVRRLWLTSFDPYYDIASLMLGELDYLYGAPQPLQHLPPSEQAIALSEQRVLGTYRYRNFDDGGILFYIVAPASKLLDDVLMVYERPCRLTQQIIGWLNRNNLETMQEVRESFGLTEGS